MDPVIGSLYPRSQNRYYPIPTQPGGVGTPVVPAQPPVQEATVLTQPPYVGPPQELLGRFFPGCGHSIMSWEVVLDTIAGEPAALILCPRCGYIQNIYQPPSLLDQQDIILG
jgi:hypothetical protein